jgi:GDP-L-fucose synthase
LENPPDWVNVGTGSELTIRELAENVARVTGFPGRITTDPTKPDGTPRKLLGTRLMEGLGWKAGMPLQEGLRDAYQDFLRSLERGDARL